MNRVRSRRNGRPSTAFGSRLNVSKSMSRENRDRIGLDEAEAAVETKGCTGGT